MPSPGQGGPRAGRRGAPAGQAALVHAPEMAVARVRRRVEAGGHDVPEPVIRRRFQKSLVNFDRLYRPVTTTWRLYDGRVVGGRPPIRKAARGTSPEAGRVSRSMAGFLLQNRLASSR